MKLVITVLFSLPLMASVLIKPEAAIHAVYGTSARIEPKRLLIKPDAQTRIQKRSGVTLESKLVRCYEIRVNATKAYAILLSRTVRTKKAAVLYMYAPDHTLKVAEIIAFGEPMEYLPNVTWMQQFQDVNDSSALQLGSGVHIITGATLSARTVSDGARLASAIMAEALQ